MMPEKPTPPLAAPAPHAAPSLEDRFLQKLAPLPLAAQMRAWDAGALRVGIPEMVLMENAARAACAVLHTEGPALRGSLVCLYMGSGNNGGDAACLARQLLNTGALPLVVHTRPLRAYTGSPGRQIRMARNCGVPFVLAPRTGLNPQDCGPQDAIPENFLARIPRWRAYAEAPVLVDGLLGTGFRGALRPDMLALIADMRSRAGKAFILALDIPSGLDSLTGQPSPLAVKATVTVTFQAAKPGLYMPAAAAHTGRVLVRDIGIPPCVQAATPPAFRLLESGCTALLSRLGPSPAQSYKNAFGHVLVLGGSPGLSGAAHLAARAALRSGAGLVSVAAPAALTAEIKNGLPDIMTLGLHADVPGAWPALPLAQAHDAAPCDDGSPALPLALASLLQSCTALLIGPGMGRSPEAAALVAAVLAQPQRPPALIDADALHFCPLSLLGPCDVLTPHPGEAAALLQCTAAHIQADRLAALQALCRLAPAVWLLKGAGSLIGQQVAGKKIPVLLSPYVVPALSVGGTGDVLSGCIAALLHPLRHCGSLAAAALGLVLHAEAGTLLQGEYPARGNLASQVADALAHVRSRA